MTAALVSLGSFAASWADAMRRASWQGAIALALAWVLCHTLARRSGRAQSWIWRVAYLKFAAALILLAPLNLAFLPAAQPPTALVAAQEIAPQSAAPMGATGLPQQTRASQTLAPSPPPASSTTLSPALWLLMIWSIGVPCVLMYFALGHRHAHRLRQTAKPITDGNLRTVYSNLAAKTRLHHPPALLSTPSPLAPVLSGLFHPAILLPECLLSAPHNRLALILTHELAHARRRDLFWNHFHAAITALFFFHPLVWLARRPVRFAQELACDELTLSLTRAKPAEYASTLLDVLTLQNHLRRAPMSVGVADSASSMRRRLQAMTTLTPWSKRRLITTATLLTACAAIGLVPWRLVAQTNPPATRPSATPTTATAPFNATIQAGSAHFEGGVTLTRGDTTVRANTVALQGPMTLTAAATPPSTHTPPSPPSSISFPAQIHAPTITLSPPVSGTLTDILAKPGQHVKKGDVLFKLDNHAAAAQVAKDQANVTIAEEKLKTARIQEQQIRAGVLPVGAASVEQAQAEVQAQRVTLEADEAVLDATNIRAPFDGALANFDLAPGAFVNQGAPLTQVVNTSDLSAVAQVAVPYDVKVGQKITFHLDRANFPGDARDFPGEVTYVSPTLDTSTGTYEVSARLTGDTTGLKPGTAGDVRISETR